MLYGGRHERARRAGTENVPGIVGLGKAAEMAQRTLGARRRPDDGGACATASRAAILRRSRGDGRERRRGAAAFRTPRTSIFDYIEGEALVIALDLKGLAVSTGAACSSGRDRAFARADRHGPAAGRARASLRFSLGKQNTAEDVDFALSLIPDTVARLRELSPVYPRVVVRS